MDRNERGGIERGRCLCYLSPSPAFRLHRLPLAILARASFHGCYGYCIPSRPWAPMSPCQAGPAPYCPYRLYPSSPPSDLPVVEEQKEGAGRVLSMDHSFSIPVYSQTVCWGGRGERTPKTICLPGLPDWAAATIHRTDLLEYMLAKVSICSMSLFQRYFRTVHRPALIIHPPTSHVRASIHSLDAGPCPCPPAPTSISFVHRAQSRQSNSGRVPGKPYARPPHNNLPTVYYSCRCSRPWAIFVLLGLAGRNQPTRSHLPALSIMAGVPRSPDAANGSCRTDLHLGTLVSLQTLAQGQSLITLCRPRLPAPLAGRGGGFSLSPRVWRGLGVMTPPGGGGGAPPPPPPPQMAQLHTALFELTMESLIVGRLSQSTCLAVVPQRRIPRQRRRRRNKLAGRVASTSCTVMYHPTSEKVILFGDRQEITAHLILSCRRVRPPTARHVALRPFCAGCFGPRS